MRFELQRKQLLRYLRWNNFLALFFSTVPFVAFLTIIFLIEGTGAAAWVWTYGIFLVTGVTLFFYLRWYTSSHVAALDYQIEDHILHVEEGVFTYKRKAIPLDRVTDIRLVQGLLMRWLGIWRIDVQTASHGQMGAEGSLWAVEAPKEVRNQLLTARQVAVKAQRVEAAA